MENNDHHVDQNVQVTAKHQENKSVAPKNTNRKIIKKDGKRNAKISHYILQVHICSTDDQCYV